MRLYLADIFALLSAAAGWYYLFYSRAAGKLAGLESFRQNRLRIQLRKINGILMFLLAIGFFAGFNSVDADQSPRAFLLIWTGVLFVLCLVTILVMIDMRLTWKLRHRAGAKDDR